MSKIQSANVNPSSPAVFKRTVITMPKSGMFAVLSNDGGALSGIVVGGDQDVVSKLTAHMVEFNRFFNIVEPQHLTTSRKRQAAQTEASVHAALSNIGHAPCVR